MSEIAAEVALESGAEVELFLPIPKPPVRLFGAAVNVGGHPLASITEINASTVHYLVVVQLPQDLNCYSKSLFRRNQIKKVNKHHRLPL